MSRETASVYLFSVRAVTGRQEELWSAVRYTSDEKKKKNNFKYLAKMIDSANVRLGILLVSQILAKCWRKPGGWWSGWWSLWVS